MGECMEQRERKQGRKGKKSGVIKERTGLEGYAEFDAIVSQEIFLDSGQVSRL